MGKFHSFIRARVYLWCFVANMARGPAHERADLIGIPCSGFPRDITRHRSCCRMAISEVSAEEELLQNYSLAGVTEVVEAGAL